MGGGGGDGGGVGVVVVSMDDGGYCCGEYNGDCDKDDNFGGIVRAGQGGTHLFWVPMEHFGQVYMIECKHFS